jgi:hypothetical protein
VSGIADQASQVFGALGGAAGISALFTIGAKRRAARSKSDADAVKTAVSLLPVLREEVAYWSGLVETERAKFARRENALRAEIAWLREYLRTLIDRIRGLGGDVPPAPAVSVPDGVIPEGLFDTPEPPAAPKPRRRRTAPRKEPDPS